MYAVHTDIEDRATEKGIRRQNARPKLEPVQQKRTALGTITNRTRVQPFRNAKSIVPSNDSENVYPDVLSKIVIDKNKAEDFNIYVDDEEPKQVTTKTESNISETLNYGLTSLPVSLPPPCRKDVHPLQDLSCSESPMVLDTSDDEKLVTSIIHRQPDVIVDVPEYGEEIYAYMREAELRNRPKLSYMRKQPDITTSMRAILIDWLVEVAEEYKLHRETLFLAVNYIDRFLSQMSVLRGKLQLVGAASMFLAAKYEEIYPPDVGEFVYITDNTYTQKQVLRMEHLILKVLEFSVAVPTINLFCEKFLKLFKHEERVTCMSMYLCELTLVHSEQFLRFVPSTIAASAISLACRSFNNIEWGKIMEDNTGYCLSDLSDCIREIVELMKVAPTHPQQAIQEKYSTSSYYEVSHIQPPAL